MVNITKILSSFITRAHAIEVDISHSPSALIGENLPLTVNVRNTDDREVGVKLSVYLRPGDEDDGAYRVNNLQFSC